jgi:hypothetical protein
MTDLSRAAQAIEDAYFNADGFGYRNGLAAALRAAVNQVLPIEHEIIDNCWYEKADPIRKQFLAIAAELDGSVTP